MLRAIRLGPLNGGVPWPSQFRSERHREKEWLSYVRGAYKLLPGYHATRRNAAAILVASRATEGQVPDRYRDKCFYIPENGVRPEDIGEPRVMGSDAGAPLQLAFVGRLVPYKGCDMLVEAISDLVREGRVRLTVVGDGPERPHLERMVEERGLGDGVTFTVGFHATKSSARSEVPKSSPFPAFVSSVVVRCSRPWRLRRSGHCGLRWPE